MSLNLKKIVCTALLGVFLLSGCEAERQIPSEISVTESTEFEESLPFPAVVCGVTLEKAVEKAVSLSPAVTEIICEIGFQSRFFHVKTNFSRFLTYLDIIL